MNRDEDKYTHSIYDHRDNAHGRIFNVGLGGSATNTIESCVSACAAQGYTIAGTEYAGQFVSVYHLVTKVDSFHAAECYCGNNLVNGATTAPEADCNMGCSGKTTYVVFIPLYSPPLPNLLSSEACGGPNRLSVYSKGPITSIPVPGPRTTGLPGQWGYKGCLRFVQLLETINLVFHIFLANLRPKRCSHTKSSGQPITLP